MNLSLKSKVKKLCLSIVFIVGACLYGFSEIYLTGTTTCVQPGIPYTYTVENVVFEQYVWNITGGTIQGSNTGTSITVIWSSASCTAPPYGCLGQINVEGQNYIQQWCSDPWGWFEDCSYWATMETKTITTSVPTENYGGEVIPANFSIPYYNYTGLYFQTVNYLQTPQDLIPIVYWIGQSIPAGDCNGYTSLQWEQSNDYEGPYTPIAGATGLTYHFTAPLMQTTYFRRRVSSASFPDAYSNIIKIEVISPNQIENRTYVKENTVAAKGYTNWGSVDQLPVGKKFTSTTYLDELGRPIQKVDKEVSSSASGSWNDMVQHVSYDAAGRTPNSYLPFPSSSTIGQFKTSPVTELYNFTQQKFNEPFPNGQVNYENSPLQRIISEYAPGTSWIGGNTGISYQYDYNTALENVRIWNIDFSENTIPVSNTNNVYANMQLYKIVTTDEKLKKVIEYKDFAGNVVLKKVQDKEPGQGLSDQHAGWACTYYVYDDFNRLRFIIPPKAVEWLDANNWALSSNASIVNEFCFWYEYDKRGRTIRKKSPGSAVVEMVYDDRDRLVFTQDGKQRDPSQNKWQATLYDQLNRPVITAIITYSSGRSALQNFVNSFVNDGNSYSMNVVTDGYQTHTILVNNAVLPAGNSLDIMSVFYYDHYNYPRVKSFSSAIVIDNTVPADEIIPVVQNGRTTGMTTGAFIRVLDGSNKFLATTYYYDDDGNTIQTHAENTRNATDVTTVQYDFAGRIRSSYTTHVSNIGTLNIYNRNILDKIGRVIKISESINNFPAKELVEYTYDELGTVIKKRLAPGFSGEDGQQLETQDFEYNIRGWLTGINKNYINSIFQTGRYFGMEIGYDKLGTNFTKTEKNGNISGVSWKSRGDNIQRRYEYQYDNKNQLLHADFKQKNTPGAGWTNDKANFSSNFTYDINGNIKTFVQSGIIPGLGVQTIDNLSYFYRNSEWSNQLLRVDESVTGAWNGKLGDFKNGANGNGANDYTYNADGQLIKDLNKEIGNSTSDGIEYNILGMPSKVTFKNSGKTITYVYDAAGNKLRKVVNDPSVAPAFYVTTDYIDDFVYNNGALEFFSHAEGRVRIITPVFAGGGAASYLTGGVALPSGKMGIYDYYIKDHLSNIRMILTEETHQVNALATMELANNAAEQPIFGQPGSGNELAASRVVKPQEWTSNPTGYVSRLSTIGTDKKIGPNVLLRVMSGDRVSANTNYFYGTFGQGQTSNIVNDVVNSLIGVLANSNAAGSLIKQNSTIFQNNFLNPGDVKSFIENPGPNTTAPRAYITMMFFDEQFNFVQESSIRVQVQNAGDGNYYLPINPREATKNGYVFIYLSNESNKYVYFDHFQVTHTRGRIIEENHYYAYGSKMAGISSAAMPSGMGGAKQNSRVNYGFQGDFSEEDIDAQWNEFDLRTYDPQIGRFTSVDPYDQFTSPYIGMGNNPASTIDPSGGWSEMLTALVSGIGAAAITYGTLSIIDNNNGNREIKGKALYAAGAGLLAAGVGYAWDKSHVPYGVTHSTFGAEFVSFYAGLLGFENRNFHPLSSRRWADYATSPDIWGSFTWDGFDYDWINASKEIPYTHILRSITIGQLNQVDALDGYKNYSGNVTLPPNNGNLTVRIDGGDRLYGLSFVIAADLSSVAVSITANLIVIQNERNEAQRQYRQSGINLESIRRRNIQNGVYMFEKKRIIVSEDRIRVKHYKYLRIKIFGRTFNLRFIKRWL
jgi:RHS repeat-associated protein